MKSKLVLLISLGTLALGAVAPNLMANTVKASSNMRRAEAVRKSATVHPASGRVPKKAAVPSHTILP